MSENIENNSNDEFIFTIDEIKTMQGFSTVIKRALEKAYPYTHIIAKPHTKNNGITLFGLTICDMEYNMSPTFYLDSLFQDYKHGRSIDDICNHLINLYEDHKPNNNFPVELYADFDNISDRICYKLINYEANKAALEHKPYIPYFDLAIVFYLPIEENNVSGTLDITNTMMKSWNIGTAFHLFDYAHNNTEKIRGLRYGTMQDLMKNILPAGLYQQEWQDLLDESLPPTYVATNTDKLHGACCILYEDALEKFADMIGGSFYILPSSLHEIIMIPSDAETDPLSLILLVRDVNLTALSPDEVLSEYIYFYDEIHKRLSLCTGLE